MLHFTVLLLLTTAAIAKVCKVAEDCGCPADGVSAATACLRSCIEQCHKESPEGATLLFGKGKYLTGALNLSSFMTLYLDSDAEILGSLDPTDYPLVQPLPGFGTTRDNVPKGHEGVRHQALISGWNMTGTSIKGRGIINGQAHQKGPDGLIWYDRRTYGRPRLIEPMFCKDFLIEDVQLQNSAFWTLHPYACNGVVIRGVNITARGHKAPNSDGIDPDSTSNVLVENCFVDVGDDSVAIKSGMDYAGRQFAHPSQNMIFRNSHFVQNAMAIGSEESGGVRNITFENIVMGPRHEPYTEGPLIHLKAMRGRGGYIKDIVFRNITMLGETRQAINVAMHYGNPEPPPTNASATPVFENILFDGITIEAADRSGEFVGLPESNVVNVTMRNVVVQQTNNSWTCQYVRGFTASNVKPSSKCVNSTEGFQVVL